MSRNSSLFPRLDRTLADEVAYLLTDERIGDRCRILQCAPDPTVKARLRVRFEELNARLLPARPADIAQRVAQMFLGFGSKPDDAKAVAAQYVLTLRHMPLWAIGHACERFETGTVTEAECPKWNASYVPSTAQLCRVAEKAIAKFSQEMRDINDCSQAMCPTFRTKKSMRGCRKAGPSCRKHSSGTHGRARVSGGPPSEMEYRRLGTHALPHSRSRFAKPTRWQRLLGLRCQS
jgi:hypothetical protein